MSNSHLLSNSAHLTSPGVTESDSSLFHLDEASGGNGPNSGSYSDEVSCGNGPNSSSHSDEVSCGNGPNSSSHLEETNSGSGPNSGSYHSLPLDLPEDEDPQLVNKDEKYECPVCVMNKSSHRLLRKPVQTRCGHRMCEACVEVYLGKELSKMCPINEDDCEQVTRNTIFQDPGCRREIKQLLVYCCYNSNGCQRQIKLSMLEKHQAECEFRNVDCIYLSRGCTMSVLFKDLETHQTGCEYQPVMCELCNTECSLINKREHDTEICPETIVNCPYQCGSLNLKRKLIDDHKSVCPRKPEICRFKSLGCTFTGSKKQINNHEQDVSIHFKLFLECFTSLKMQSLDQQKEIEECKQQSLENAKSNKKIENSLTNIHKDLRFKMIQLLERLIIAEKTIDELTQAMANSAQESQKHVQSVEQLKAQIPQVAAHDRQLASLSIQMASTDLRFQMNEMTSYDGTLIWKISDFSKRKRDAEEGRTVSLYSQPFYTSRFGYKMCARVYPNGDGIGRGTHMSLYFVVMKGDYDAILPWPFQCKVALMMLDQSPLKHHLKDEFIPDPVSTSFKQPENAQMNVASGCPLFVSHSVLTSSRNTNYIKNDVLFIKIIIDTTNLQPV